MSYNLQEISDYIISLTREAGEIFKEGYYGAKEIKQKTEDLHDLVTDYDTRIEDMLFARIGEKYPTHK